MDQELVQYLDGRFNDVNERIRYNSILVEGLRDQVHLLAEGLATHIEAEGVRHQAIQEQFRETRALLHLSYEQLHQRVESLDWMTEHLSGVTKFVTLIPDKRRT